MVPIHPQGVVFLLSQRFFFSIIIKKAIAVCFTITIIRKYGNTSLCRDGPEKMPIHTFQLQVTS